MATTEPVDPEFTLGNRYRNAREKAGLTQEELADEIGVSPRTVSRYETGAVEHPRKIVRKQWALRCAVREDYLLPAWPGGDEHGEGESGAIMRGCPQWAVDLPEGDVLGGLRAS